MVAKAMNFIEAGFTSCFVTLNISVSDRLHLGWLHCVCALSRLLLVVVVVVVVVRSRPCSETCQGPYNSPTDTPHMHASTHTGTKVVHQNRLWAYTGANAPDWFQGKEPAARPSSHTPAGTVADEATNHPTTDKSPRPLQRSKCLRRPPDFYGDSALAAIKEGRM